ncbi:MAG: CHAT domain-containing protein [Acidobacteriota bacterium]
MPSYRNLRWVGLALAGLLGLVLAIVGTCRRNDTTAVSDPPRKEAQIVPETVKLVGEPQRLEVGRPLERELKGGEGHVYEFELKAGEYAHAVADQRGIDVAARLIGPDGKLVIRVDSPNGAYGPEPVHEIAEQGGLYRLEVVCEDPNAAPGRYEMRLEALRPATERDRKVFFADRRFAAGEELRREGLASYPRALERYREALPVWKELADQERTAETLFRIGWLSQEIDELDAASPVLDEALPLFRQLGNRGREGVVLNMSSVIHFEHGEFDSALEMSRQALALSREIGDPGLEAGALNNTGNAYAARGKFQEALDAYREALEISRRIGQGADEGLALFGIGDVLTDLGSLDEALDSLEKAQSVDRSLGLSREEAGALRRMGNIHQRLGQLEKSEQYLQKALAIYRGLSDARREAVTLNDLGTVYLLQKKTGEAGQAYQQALPFFEGAKDRYNEALALSNLGRYHYAVKEFRKAFELHDRAASVFRSIGNLPGEVSASFGSARALHELKEFEAADTKLQWVLEHVEVLRDEPGIEGQRISYFGTKQHYYDLHIDVLMHLHELRPEAGYDSRAFAINERRRARGLLDLLVQSKTRARQGADSALIAREQEARARLNELSLKLLGSQERSADHRGALEKELTSLMSEVELLRSRIAERSPEYAALSRPEPLSREEIQSRVLDRVSSLLVYSLGEERSYLWYIPHRGDMKSYVLPARSWIEDAARQVQKAWSRENDPAPDPGARWADRLSEILLAPVPRELLTERLVVVADGALQYVPFAALPTPGSGEPLVRNHEIVNLISASVLARLRRDLWDRDRAEKLIAVVADPVFSSGDPRLTHPRKEEAGGTSGPGDLARAARDVGLNVFDPLPFTKREAGAIRGLVGETQRFEALGFDASREAVLGGALKNYQIVHFATHGILNERHPELSGLVLSLVDAEGRPQDGFLRSYEISDLDLGADLAVLSACQTGLGSDIRGEGLVGLTRSFVSAGVPRLVVSLWSVSDRGTAELMRRFYKALLVHGLAPPTALRCAQISMLKNERLSDPYYWAAFVFQGEWNQEAGLFSDSIETAPSGSKQPAKSDNDLPPPDYSGPFRCPELD